MPFRNKKSFFEKITNLVNAQDDDSGVDDAYESRGNAAQNSDDESLSAETDGQLTIDVFQTPTEIVVQSIVAGVKPDDLSINLSREMVIIKGKRVQSQTVTKDNYYYQELYWGSFSRSVVLPEEVDVENADATEKNGLLTIRLPKIDKQKSQKLKVKSDKN